MFHVKRKNKIIIIVKSYHQSQLNKDQTTTNKQNLKSKGETTLWKTEDIQQQ